MMRSFCGTSLMSTSAGRGLQRGASVPSWVLVSHRAGCQLKSALAFNVRHLIPGVLQCLSR